MAEVTAKGVAKPAEASTDRVPAKAIALRDTAVDPVAAKRLTVADDAVTAKRHAEVARIVDEHRPTIAIRIAAVSTDTMGEVMPSRTTEVTDMAALLILLNEVTRIATHKVAAHKVAARKVAARKAEAPKAVAQKAADQVTQDPKVVDEMASDRITPIRIVVVLKVEAPKVADEDRNPTVAARVARMQTLANRLRLRRWPS